ncbi:putative reverse transcriptase domain-containing protein [Tanacetum coccineum]
MAAPIISISYDLSKESVGSQAPRVILYVAIPAIITVIPEVPIVLAHPIVAPKVGTVSVVSPARVLGLVDYSSSFDSDPSEDSLPPVPDLPLVLPFLCSDDSEADGESEPAEQRPERHESLAAHDTLAPSSEFPLAPIVAPSGIRRCLVTLIRPGEAIPFGQPYRTHPNRPRRLLTARKRVRPFLAHILAWRRISHHSSDRHSSPDSSSSSPSSDSLSDSSPVHSSRCDSLGQAHSGPSTRDASPRLVYPSVLTPRHSEAFRRWRSAPLSTFYPLTTLESSLGSSSERSLDSSSPSFGPPRKRCRSLTASVPSPTHDPRSINPTLVDPLPPRTSDGVIAHTKDGVDMRVEIAASDVREDDEELEAEAGAADTREIVVDPLAIGEVRIDRITEIEMAQRQLKASQLVASGERVGLSDKIMSLRIENLKKMTITRSGMTPEAIEKLVNRRVEDALAAYEATRAANALEAENQRQNGSDSYNRNGRNRNGEKGNGRNEKPNENNRDDRLVARECTYQDFLKCQPLNFKGTEGVVGLIKWFKKMETVFHISNFPEKDQVKYATCTLLNSALTWWNSHKRTIGAKAAFAMSWRELMKLMAEVYCPRNEIQKIESELRNLTMKNNDLAAYTQRFQELTMMCTKMVPKEEDRVKKFIGGLPDNIQGNVITDEPTRLQDAVRIANNLMDQKLKGYAVKNFEKRRRLEKIEDKSEEKRLEDVPTIQDFPKDFPEDLPGLPPTRQVEFQIDLVPGAAPVARAPYRLALSELQELSTQLQELYDKGFIRPSSSP